MNQDNFPERFWNYKYKHNAIDQLPPITRSYVKYSIFHPASNNKDF